MKGPLSCIVSTPDSRTVRFRGQYINVSQIAVMQGLDKSYISRVFRGERDPSLATAKRIAACLGMGVGEFVEALDEHIQALRAADQTIVDEHYKRIEKEDSADMATLRRGGIPAPRLPGQRSKIA